MHVMTMPMKPPALLAVQPDGVTLVLRDGLMPPSAVEILARLLSQVHATKIEDVRDRIQLDLEAHQQDRPQERQTVTG